MSVAIYKNGVIYKCVQQVSGSAGIFGLSGSCIVYCNGITDYIQMYANPNGASVLSGLSQYDRFEGYYLRSV